MVCTRLHARSCILSGRRRLGHFTTHWHQREDIVGVQTKSSVVLTIYAGPSKVLTIPVETRASRGPSLHYIVQYSQPAGSIPTHKAAGRYKGIMS